MLTGTRLCCREDPGQDVARGRRHAARPHEEGAEADHPNVRADR